MDILIQNLGSNPLMVHVPSKEGNSISHTFVLQENTVTKIPAEVYENCILKSDFYRMRIADGVVRVLNGNEAEDAAQTAANKRDFAYSKYVDLMKKIQSTGGLANAAVRQHLNTDGTPNLELLNLNFGRNIDPAVADEFRQRWLAENKEGLHEDVLRLPGGAKQAVAPRDVKLEKEAGIEENAAYKELESKTFEELCEIADTYELKYRKNIEKESLIKKILAFIDSDKEADEQ
jgi:hypothetical protein